MCVTLKVANIAEGGFWYAKIKEIQQLINNLAGKFKKKYRE